MTEEERCLRCNRRHFTVEDVCRDCDFGIHDSDNYVISCRSYHHKFMFPTESNRLRLEADKLWAEGDRDRSSELHEMARRLEMRGT